MLFNIADCRNKNRADRDVDELVDASLNRLSETI
jgi:hypothetical protein